MKQHTIFNQWWLHLMQGILLLGLSLIQFLIQMDQIIIISKLTGFVAMLNGFLILAGHYLAAKEDGNRFDFLIGFSSCLIGVFFIAFINFIDEFVYILHLVFLFLSSIYLLTNFWNYKSTINWWWLNLVILFTTFLVILIIKAVLPKGVYMASVLIGFQLFINGLFLILMAFTLRKFQLEFELTIGQLKKEHLL
jgi:uncharacterized membrane protein HdeD (DUF308 family)